jgi:ketosteroid isomerase-like protein
MDDIERMLIERACQRLVLQFAQANDDWDHDGIAECFVEDASFARPIDPDNPYRGKETIRAMFRDRPQRLGRHLMTNILIHVDGPDAAHGRSYVTYLSTPDVDQPRPALAEPGIFVGWFDDKFVRTPHGWRISERKGGMALRSGGEIPTAGPRPDAAKEG